jgi:hypothetical protein
MGECVMTDVDVLFVRGTIRLTSGRLSVAASQIASLFDAEERAALGPIAQAAIESADEWARLEREHRVEPPKTYGDLAREADTAADATVGVVFDVLTGYTRMHGPSTPLGDAARDLLGALFPQGRAALTGQGFADEVVKLERVVADAKQPKRAAEIASIPGLAPLLTELEARTAAYREALDRPAPKGVTYAEVIAAAKRADRRMMELLAAIFTLYRGDEAAAARRRSELIEPFKRMLANLRDRFRQQLPPSDVNADGEVIEDERAEGDDASRETAGAAEKEPA